MYTVMYDYTEKKMSQTPFLTKFYQGKHKVGQDTYFVIPLKIYGCRKHT